MGQRNVWHMKGKAFVKKNTIHIVKHAGVLLMHELAVLSWCQTKAFLWDHLSPQIYVPVENLWWY